MKHKYKFNEHGVCENPKIVWRGIYNTYGGKNAIHPLYGVSFISIARIKGSWVYGYSVGTQFWMSLGGCGINNERFPTAKDATIAGLRFILALVNDQMKRSPIREEKDRLRSLIADIGKEIFNQKQLTLF